MDQAAFLDAMGISARLKMLLDMSGVNEKQKRTLVDGVNRLISTEPGGMGKLYKFLAMMPKEVPASSPYPFCEALEKVE